MELKTRQKSPKNSIKNEIKWVISGEKMDPNGCFWVRKNGDFLSADVGKSRKKPGCFT